MDAVADCFSRTGIGAFPGDCEAHRVGILVGRGAWSQGELEARRACAQVERIELTHVGEALHEIGEIRLRLGNLPGAADAFERATTTGASPQPSLAPAPAERCGLSGRLDRNCPGRHPGPARPVGELDEVAGVYGSAALAAAAACACGVLLLADGDAQAAAGTLRDGMRLWQEASAPYETARARMLLAEALRRMGTTSRALVELRAARSSLESLGARLDAERATRLIDESAPAG